MSKRKKVFRPLVWILLLTMVVLLSLVVRKHHRTIYREVRKVYHNMATHERSTPPKKLRPSLALGVAVPSDYHVFGLDVSRHQGKIDWKKLSKFSFEGYKFEFVYIKASEGKSWVDRKFDYNWQKAKKYNILRGAYHFYRPKVNSTIQMENFISVVDMQKGDLPPVLDVEVESSLSKSKYREGVLNCLKIMETTYGIQPIVYTNQQLYREYFKHKSFEKYHFWISRLKSSPPRMDNWLFWQFTYEGVISGSNEYVDINVFNGDITQLKSLTKK